MPCAHRDTLKFLVLHIVPAPLEKQISSKLLTKKALHSPRFCWMQLKHLEETVLGRLVGCGLFAVSREGLMTFTPVSPWHQRAAPGVHVVLHLSPARSHALPEP